MDMADNYSGGAQDEIQPAQWNQNQVTLFTAVAWFKGTINCQVIVSDFMEHTKKAVVPLLDEVLKLFPPGIQEVRVWTDGPSSQFKNRFVMATTKTLTQWRGINLSWNFSATSHGKGPVDGTGVCLKRIATDKVKTRQYTINNTVQFLRQLKVHIVLLFSLHPNKWSKTLGGADTSYTRGCEPKIVKYFLQITILLYLCFCL